MEEYGFQLIRQRMGKTFIASVEYTFQRSTGRGVENALLPVE
jgi:hypothetical protein